MAIITPDKIRAAIAALVLISVSVPYWEIIDEAEREREAVACDQEFMLGASNLADDFLPRIKEVQQERRLLEQTWLNTSPEDPLEFWAQGLELTYHAGILQGEFNARTDALETDHQHCLGEIDGINLEIRAPRILRGVARERE